MATRKVKGTQIIESPPALFTVVGESTRNEWVVRVRDAIRGDEPSWSVPLTTGSKANRRDVTIEEVCRVGMREANEGRAVLYLTEYRNGLPVYQAMVSCQPGWASTSRGAVPVFRPLWSTDPARTKVALPWHEPPSQFVCTQWR